MDHAKQIGWKVMLFVGKADLSPYQKMGPHIHAPLVAEFKVALGLRRCWPPEARSRLIGLRVRRKGRVGFCVRLCRGRRGPGGRPRRDGLPEKSRLGATNTVMSW